MIESVRINPKGAKAHDHIRRARVICSRHALEKLLGTPHSEGDGTKTSAMWFLVTPNGTATIFNYWAFGEDDYGIAAASNEVAGLVVDWLRENQLHAYTLAGEIE